MSEWSTSLKSVHEAFSKQCEEAFLGKTLVIFGDKNQRDFEHAHSGQTCFEFSVSGLAPITASIVRCESKINFIAFFLRHPEAINRKYSIEWASHFEAGLNAAIAIAGSGLTSTSATTLYNRATHAHNDKKQTQSYRQKRKTPPTMYELLEEPLAPRKIHRSEENIATYAQGVLDRRSQNKTALARSIITKQGMNIQVRCVKCKVYTKTDTSPTFGTLGPIKDK